MREGGGGGGEGLRKGVKGRETGEGCEMGKGDWGRGRGRKTRQGRRLGKGRYTNVPSAINADDFSHHQT